MGLIWCFDGFDWFKESQGYNKTLLRHPKSKPVLVPATEA